MQKVFMALCAIVVLSLDATAGQKTVLSKMYHNACHARTGQQSVELGEITFVFSSAPVINQLPSATGKREGSVSFFVPNATIQSSLKGLKKLTCPQNDAYQVTMQEVTAPTDGVLFEVQYKPDRVMFLHDIFPRVTREHKLVFHFYDKGLLQKIEAKKESPMIMHASLNPSVIIDCGHGGTDPGVVGLHHTVEKNICLAVGQIVADTLKKKGVRVVLTRTDDESVSLNQRIAQARESSPHLFVSIHANAARDNRTRGIETFYFDRKECSLIAKDGSVGDLNIDSYRQHLSHMSKRLAYSIQHTVCTILDRNGMPTVNRNIKPEPLQVLMGSSVPAALIEIGFLTNGQEANLLSQNNYQASMADGICKGILAFIQDNSLPNKL